MTGNGEEWTDWIEHDGGACPLPGAYMHIVFDQGYPIEKQCIVRGMARAWVHDVPITSRLNGRVIGYRVRKPRALLSMIEEAKKLDAPVKEPAQ